MKVHQACLRVATAGSGWIDITPDLGRLVAESGVVRGICQVFVRHTSASLVISENADSAVLRDLMRAFERLAPEDFPYEHDDEGPDDMPAHIRSALTSTSETIPIMERRLSLGVWQAVYLFEHRHSKREREVVVTVLGVAD